MQLPERNQGGEVDKQKLTVLDPGNRPESRIALTAAGLSKAAWVSGTLRAGEKEVESRVGGDLGVRRGGVPVRPHGRAGQAAGAAPS